MFCNKCGFEIGNNEKFCNQCGNKLIIDQPIVNTGIRCPHCGSGNVSIQMITESKLKNKHHSILYWLFIGWWLEVLLWFFLTIPRLLIFIFMPKKQRIVQKQRKVAICQSCGYSWNK